jgi:hypothetical protein
MNLKALLPQTQLIDDRSISVYLVSFKIIEKSPSLPDQFKKTPARVMVSFVTFKVFRQIPNPFAEDSDLNLRGTGVPIVVFKLVDDLFLFLLNECHEILLIKLHVTF